MKIHFIRPGKPVENAYIESFNGKFRDECLNENWFFDLEDARAVIEAWRVDYNEVRPHSSLDEATPAEFARSVAIAPIHPVGDVMPPAALTAPRALILGETNYSEDSRGLT